MLKLNKIGSILTQLSAVAHYTFSNGSAQKRIRRVIYDITYKCNLRCSFCFYYNQNFLEETTQKAKIDELTTQEIKNILIPQLKELKVEYVTLTGGEPLIREDFIDILKAFSENGFYVTVLSNLTLCNEEIAKAIVKYANRLVASIEGPEEIHDSLTRVSGSFQRTINALKQVLEQDKEKRLDLSIRYVITKHNLKYLKDMIVIAKKIGIREVSFSFPEWQTQESVNHARSRAETYQVVSAAIISEHKEVDIDELYAQYLLAKEQAEISGVRMLMEPISEPNKMDFERWYYDPTYSYVNKCLVPFIQLRITPNGDVMPCLEVNMGNIKKERLTEIWNNEEYRCFRRTIRRKLLPRCSKCCKLCEPAYKYLMTIR